MFTTPKYQAARNMSMTLRIIPRAAALTIAGDASLDEPYRLSWEGAAPTVRDGENEVAVDYGFGSRLRVRRASLAVLLNPALAWSIELAGGVSGLRAALGGLDVTGIGITGGASDVEIDLPQPVRDLPLRIEGGVSGAVLRRPEAVPVGVRIDGGVRDLHVDYTRFGAMSGLVLERAVGEPGAAAVALDVAGGARGLTIGVR
jgi:hypothetical protein